MNSIQQNVRRVQANMAEACAKAGRAPGAVTLIAVSKTHPAEMVLAAAAAGVQHFGENRVEESAGKIPQVRAALQGGAALKDELLIWHMVGHVQSRKADDAARWFDVIQSVDSVKLAQRLSRAAREPGAPVLDVLIEVNVSGEASKAGFAALGWQQDASVYAQLAEALRPIVALPGLRVRGLMTIAPIVAVMEEARPVFASLRGLRDRLAADLATPLPDLSMGMTDDYPVAIEEGATMVRIGRAIFGEREAPL